MSALILTKLYAVHHPVWGDGWLKYAGYDQRGYVRFIFMVDNTCAVFTAKDLIDHNIQPFHCKANKR